MRQEIPTATSPLLGWLPTTGSVSAHSQPGEGEVERMSETVRPQRQMRQTKEGELEGRKVGGGKLELRNVASPLAIVLMKPGDRCRATSCLPRRGGEGAPAQAADN